MGHALNAGLVLLLMWRMTGSAWRSALAAAVFAIHPQRVESVAWIAERKDILCVLFGLLTLHAYVSWAKRRGVARYIMMMAMYALSLAAKPMMVTLPFAMLLLDFWPLRRVEPADTSSASNTTAVRCTVARLVIEKIPLIALALASSAVTYIVQRQSGAMESLAHISWGHRLINAATSVVAYLRQMAWPTDLAVFYPHPQSTSIGIALLAIIAVVAVSIAAFAVRRPWPQVFVGWFWFVGTLVPVSGIVQVGDQARADRYTYLPSIGLALLIAWSVPRAWTHSQSQRWLTACGAGILLLAMTWLTAQQVRYWRNSETLFARALQVTHNNFVAHSSLGQYLYETGRLDEAESHFNRALAVRSNYPTALTNLALIAMTRSDDAAAVSLLQRVLSEHPENVPAKSNLGTALARLNRLDEAIAEYRRVVELSPDSYTTTFNLGTLLALQGKPAEAAEWFTHTLELMPGHIPARGSLGMVLVQMKQLDPGIEQLQTALASEPSNAQWHNALGVALLQSGRNDEAVHHFETAIQIRPDFQDARLNLQAARSEMGP
jgi:Flp pilus assembly protein TadD